MLRILNIETDNCNHESRAILNNFTTVRKEGVAKKNCSNSFLIITFL